MTRWRMHLTALTSLAALVGSLPSPAAAAASDLSQWSFATVDSTRDVGPHLAVGVDPGTGTTFVVYYDSADEDLWLAHSVGAGGNCGPSGSWRCTALLRDGDVGTHPSLGVHPIPGGAELFIAYHDATSLALKLEKVTWYPSSFRYAAPETIDPPGGALQWRGTHTSVTVDAGGAAHIAYRLTNLAGDDALRYAHYLGTGTGNCGDDDWQCDTVRTGEGAGLDTSIALDSGGHPYIASYDSSTGHPIVSRKLGEAWTHYTITRGFDHTGRSTSLMLDGGVQVAYFNADTRKLEYSFQVAVGTGNCGADSGWRCDVIDDMPEEPGGRSVSMAADSSGLPIIAYQGVGAELRLARPAAALSGVMPNCGPHVGLARTWYCETLDAGTVLTNEAAAVAVATDGDGSPRVAYHHLYFGTSPAVGSLRVAFEDLDLFADGFESGDDSRWSTSAP